MSELPVVLVPVGVDDDALDACLAALDAGTPSGARVWLADDAQAGPRGLAIVERWLARTPLRADYTRRQRSVGEAAHLDDMLKACGDADVLVLSSDAVPLPGWATQLAACAARDPAIATATPWCNAGETAAWPRVGEVMPPPDEPARLARAAASLPPHHPELPSAVNHAVFLRGAARKKAGGLDAESYASWYAALIDLSLRMAGFGWRNALCETAFVARAGEGAPLGDDVETLGARWPGWHARLAQFLMQDPLHALRASLTRAYHATEPRDQPDLFADGEGGER
ncbi:MAG: glycosyltransferase [Aquabacterium sp.]